MIMELKCRRMFFFSVVFITFLQLFSVQGHALPPLTPRTHTDNNSSCAHIPSEYTAPSVHEGAAYCKYPNLWSIEEKKCAFFKEVKCGNRSEPISPCEYLNSNCTKPFGKDVALCTCETYADVNFELCLNKPDMNVVWPNRKWTQFYIQCLTRRTIPRNCSDYKIFNFIDGKCDDRMTFVRQAYNLSMDIPPDMQYLINFSPTTSGSSQQSSESIVLKDWTTISTIQTDKNTTQLSEQPISNLNKVPTATNTNGSLTTKVIYTSSDVFQPFKSEATFSEASTQQTSLDSTSAFDKIRKYVHESATTVSRKRLLPHGHNQNTQILSKVVPSTLVDKTFISTTPIVDIPIGISTPIYQFETSSYSLLETKMLPQIAPSKVSMLLSSSTNEFTYPETSPIIQLSTQFFIQVQPSLSSVYSEMSSISTSHGGIFETESTPQHSPIRHKFLTQSQGKTVLPYLLDASISSSSKIFTKFQSSKYPDSESISGVLPTLNRIKRSVIQTSTPAFVARISEVSTKVLKSTPLFISSSSKISSSSSARNEVFTSTVSSTELSFSGQPSLVSPMFTLNITDHSTLSSEAFQEPITVRPSSYFADIPSPSLTVSSLLSEVLLTQPLSSSSATTTVTLPPTSLTFSTAEPSSSPVLSSSALSVSYLYSSLLSFSSSTLSPSFSSSSSSLTAKSSLSISLVPPDVLASSSLISEPCSTSASSSISLISSSCSTSLSSSSFSNTLPALDESSMVYTTAPLPSIKSSLPAMVLSPSHSSTAEQLSSADISKSSPSVATKYSLLAASPTFYLLESSSYQTTSPSFSPLEIITTVTSSSMSNVEPSSSDQTTSSTINQSSLSPLSSSQPFLSSSSSSPSSSSKSPSPSSLPTPSTTSPPLSSLLSSSSLPAASSTFSSSKLISSSVAPTLSYSSISTSDLLLSLFSTSFTSSTILQSSSPSSSLPSSSTLSSPSSNSSLSPSISSLSSSPSSSSLSSPSSSTTTTRTSSSSSSLSSSTPSSSSTTTILSSSSLSPSMSSLSSLLSASSSSLTTTTTTTSSSSSSSKPSTTTATTILPSHSSSSLSISSLSSSLSSSSQSSLTTTTSSSTTSSSSTTTTTTTTILSSLSTTTTTTTTILSSLSSSLSQPIFSPTPTLSSFKLTDSASSFASPSLVTSMSLSISPSPAISSAPSEIQSEASASLTPSSTYIVSSSISNGNFDKVSGDNTGSDTSLIVGLSVGFTVILLGIIITTIIVLRNRMQKDKLSAVRLPPELYISDLNL